jgi:hypothetical protein
VSKTIAIRGSLLLSDGGCGGCSGDQTTKTLSIGGSAVCCDGGQSYDQATSFSTSVATVGAVGAAFADIPGLDGFSAVEFLRVTSSAKVRFRFSASRPQLQGAALPGAGVTSGAATITATDSTGTQFAATVTFSGATNTPALVVSAINAALAAAGAPFPPGGQIARLSGGGVLLVCPGVGPSAYVELAAGAPAALGLGTVLVRVTGTAQDMPDTEGLVVLQFPRSPGAPTKVQVSGVASLDIVAAGRVTA